MLRLRSLLATLACTLALLCASPASVHASKPRHDAERSNSTLVCVQVVSRHGTRAPNPAVAQLCPADRSNLALYGSLRITLAGLTGTGMGELYAMGVFARQQYIERTYPKFLSVFFNDQEVYFRAVGEDRTLQSAAAMGQGMYPAGSAPLGYSAALPSPVPVYTLPDVYDSLLEVRKQGCKAQLARDAAKWDATEGIKLYEANQPLLARLHKICNITDLNEVTEGSGDNYGDAIKDITDAFTFDMIEGFPQAEGLNESSVLEFRTMAVKQLLGRILGTDEQITYLNGELPERMLDNFLFSVWNQGPLHVADFALKMYAYHGHREMMYALASFLGIEFDIKFAALPKGAIPPATTLFFELHYVGERDAAGNIPNAFEAAGLENPYAAGLPKTPDALGESPLPWELRRRSASAVVRDQTTQHDEPTGAEPQPQTEREVKEKEDEENEKDGDDDESKERAVVPGPAERTGLYGSEELRNGHGAPFNVSDSAPSSGIGHPSPAEEYKYLPRKHAPSTAAPAAAAAKKPAATWRPAPPTDGYVVRALLWHPCESGKDSKEGEELKVEKVATKKDLKHDPRTPDCPAVPIAMHAVCDSPAEEGCTLAQLSDAIHTRLKRTGTWDQLCHAKDVRRIMADSEGVEQAARGMQTQKQSPAPVSRKRARVQGETRVVKEQEDEQEEQEKEEKSSQAEPAAAPEQETDAPIVSSNRSTERSMAAAAAPAVVPEESSSHPIFHALITLLLLGPLVCLAYFVYIKYRQSAYQSAPDSIETHQYGRVPTSSSSSALYEEEESKSFAQRVY